MQSQTINLSTLVSVLASVNTLACIVWLGVIFSGNAHWNRKNIEFTSSGRLLNGLKVKFLSGMKPVFTKGLNDHIKDELAARVVPNDLPAFVALTITIHGVRVNRRRQHTHVLGVHVLHPQSSQFHCCLPVLQPSQIDCRSKLSLEECGLQDCFYFVSVFTVVNRAIVQFGQKGELVNKCGSPDERPACGKFSPCDSSLCTCHPACHEHCFSSANPH